MDVLSSPADSGLELFSRIRFFDLQDVDDALVRYSVQATQHVLNRLSFEIFRHGYTVFLRDLHYLLCLH